MSKGSGSAWLQPHTSKYFYAAQWSWKWHKNMPRQDTQRQSSWGYIKCAQLLVSSQKQPAHFHTNMATVTAARGLTWRRLPHDVRAGRLNSTFIHALYSTDVDSTCEVELIYNNVYKCFSTSSTGYLLSRYSPWSVAVKAQTSTH